MYKKSNVKKEIGMILLAGRRIKGAGSVFKKFQRQFKDAKVMEKKTSESEEKVVCNFSCCGNLLENKIRSSSVSNVRAGPEGPITRR